MHVNEGALSHLSVNLQRLVDLIRDGWAPDLGQEIKMGCTSSGGLEYDHTFWDNIASFLTLSFHNSHHLLQAGWERAQVRGAGTEMKDRDGFSGHFGITTNEIFLHIKEVQFKINSLLNEKKCS